MIIRDIPAIVHCYIISLLSRLRCHEYIRYSDISLIIINVIIKNLFLVIF